METIFFSQPLKKSIDLSIFFLQYSYKMGFFEPQRSYKHDSYKKKVYQKLSMGSKWDNPEIGTFALIYWNHFFEAGAFVVPYADRGLLVNRQRTRVQW